MKKINNWIKNNVLVLIVLNLFCLNAVALANVIIPSNSVSYTSNKTNQTTVEGSLNELFSAVDINKRLGDTSISSIGNGTITGAINTLNTNLSQKQETISGGASTITSSNLTASRALVSNSSGKVIVSAVTSTELGYLDGVTSSVQTQINNLNNKFGNLTFATINLGKVPSTENGTTIAELPSGFTINNTFVVSLRIVRAGSYIYEDDGFMGTTYLYDNKIVFAANANGVQYCSGQYISAIVAKID